MPLYDDHEDKIRFNLISIENGERPPIISIGFFTERQFGDINIARSEYGLHPLEMNEILFLGRHLYESRTRDGYTIDDILKQIASALAPKSVAVVTRKMSCMRSIIGRNDGYGNIVFDQAVFEMTSRKPRAELFSVIPKGDLKKPKK